MGLEVIGKNSDFRKVYTRGKSIADANLVMYILRKSSEETNRFGFSVSKKIGKAVIRNRIRRVLKEICRLNEWRLVGNFDLILVARVAIKDKSYHQIESSFINLAKRARLIGD